ncbi:MAG: iron-containing alcohol dehydrogenase [Lachnospiraceae bacterium]|nr:iron-containing alcohol dehydrogenase [Lachnospiraceae bacterium]
MKDFQLCIPTNMIFGHDAQARAGELTAAWGTSALILYGSQRIVKSGLLKEITDQLEAHGVAWETFGGIQENPRLLEAEAACSLVKEKNIDVLLAIGGGSVMDLAKAVSIGCFQEESLWAFYEGKAVPHKAIPLGAIPTMAATASEANPVSVLQNEALHQKRALRHPLLYPKFALLNPNLTCTVPSAQTAMGALDIFAHAFERYFHLGQKGTLRTHLCTAVMKTVREELPRVQEHPGDYDGRAQLMWAATMAHSDMVGFEGVFACHAMSHALTGEFNIPHGGALAILMPAWCKYMLPLYPRDMAEFAVRVWDVDRGELSEVSAAQEGISRFQDFICQSSLPVTLREAGIVHADSRILAEQAMGGKDWIGENYRGLSVEDVQRIFELARG